MRAFLSIPLDDAVQNEILRFQQSAREAVRLVKWTRPGNCHLTLKFMGDILPTMVETVRAVLQPVAERFSPFTLELGGVGRFPEKGPITIVWIGVKQGVSPLVALENDIREAMTTAEIPFDKKPFVPHFTVGRAKREDRVFFDPLKPYVDLSFGILKVESFHLMESVLHPQGSIYTSRIHFPLGKQ